MTRERAKAKLAELAARPSLEMGITTTFYGETRRFFTDFWGNYAVDGTPWSRINALNALSDNYFLAEPTLIKAEKLRAFIEALPE